MIERPRVARARADGCTDEPVSRVRVREWSTGSWNVPPRERDVECAELLAEIEQAFATRRRIGQELYRVQRWLLGRSP